MLSPTLPWHREYSLLGIPGSFVPYPEKPVFHILEEAARRFRKNGVIQYDYKMTYPEVLRNAEKLAAAFLRMGLIRGDRVATILPTSIQFVVADYAISRAGLVHVPSSQLEPLETLRHKFQEGSPRALVCLAHHGDLAKGLMVKSSVKHLILTKLDDYATDVAELKGYEIVNDVPGALWLTELLAGETGNDLPPQVCDVERDIETLLFTGGTTGVPKGCMLTHRNIYANSIQNFYAVGPSARLMKGAISVLLGVPFFHSYGHSIMHTMTMLGADQILIPEPRDTGEHGADDSQIPPRASVRSAGAVYEPGRGRSARGSISWGFPVPLRSRR